MSGTPRKPFSEIISDTPKVKPPSKTPVESPPPYSDTQGGKMTVGEARQLKAQGLAIKTNASGVNTIAVVAEDPDKIIKK